MGWRRGSREVNFGILYGRYRYIKKCHVILCLTRCFYSEKLYYYPLIIPILNTNNFEQAIISLLRTSTKERTINSELMKIGF